MFRAALLALMAVSAAAARATAQQATTLQVGTHARVFVPHMKVTGSISRLDGDSVTIAENAMRITVARNEIQRVQLARRNHALGAAKFGLLGAVIGTVGGVFIGAATHEERKNCIVFCDASLDMIAGGLVFGTIGLGSGVIAGAIRGATVWKDVPVSYGTTH
jgi:hypothetical protein